MKNLKYFCHYHCGTPKDKSIKIAGSFLILSALLTWASSAAVGSAAGQRANFMAQLLPEPGYLIATVEGAPVVEQPAQTVQPVMPAPQPAPVLEGTPAPVSAPAPVPAPESSVFPQPTPVLAPQPMPQQPMPAPVMSPPQPQPMPSTPPMMQQPSSPSSGREQGMPAPQTCRVNGVEMPGPCSNYPPQSGSATRSRQGQEPNQAGPQMGPQQDQDQGQDMDDDQREQFERQMIMNEKPNVLRETRRQKGELNRLCNQLRRLRGAADDLASCQQLLARIADFETRIRAITDDIDELRSAMEEFRDAELWEEIQKIRLKVELPRELNRLLTDINRITRLLSQRAFQNLGFDVATVRSKVDAIKALHAEVRACYQSGDFECATDKMQEIREGDHPGELQGAMQMLRGIKEMSKMIRDRELKAEVDELLQPVIQSINSGEWRQAREDMQEIERELRDIMQKILASQRQRRGASEDVRARLERMRQKFEQEAPGGQDNVEEDMMPGLPSSGSSGGGGGSVMQPVTPLQQPAPQQPVAPQPTVQPVQPVF